jgi:hypothetical protein
MADRKTLNQDEFARAMLQTAAAGDLARIAGLAVAADIADIRAGQAKIEASRLRFKRGKEAPAAASVQKAAVIRAERGTYARTASDAARVELGKIVGDLAGTRPIREPAEPVKREPAPEPKPEPAPEPTPEPEPKPEPTDGGEAGAFVIEGRVTRGRAAAAGVTIEAVVTTPKSDAVAAGATTDSKGAYSLAIKDIPAIRKQLGLSAADRLAVTVVARSDGVVAAQSAEEIEVVPGGSAKAALKLT